MAHHNSESLKIACVGAGSISREFCMRYLKDGVEVTAVVDINTEAASLLARDVELRKAGAVVEGSKYRETVRVVDGDEMESVIPVTVSHQLHDVLPSVDCVYIGTPPSSHCALVLQALAAGKHVLLEKPLAVSMEDCNAIVDAAHDAYTSRGLIVNVNIGMRFNQAIHQIKSHIKDPSFGDVASISLRLHFMQWPRPWQQQLWVGQRAEGGPLLEVGTHWLFGVQEIMGHDCFESASCSTLYSDGPNGILCESVVKGTVSLQGGVMMNIDICSSSDEAKSKGKDIYELVITGSGGLSLVLYDFTKLRRILPHGEIEELIPEGGSYGRVECVQEFVKAIRGSVDANLVTPEQARNVQSIIHAIKSSG